MLTKNGKRGNDENGKGNKHKKETEVRENEEREGIDGDGELLISKHYLPSPDTDDGENIYHNNLESFFQEIKQYYQKEIFKFEQTFYESIRKQNYFNILLYKVEYKLHSPEINTIGELRKANITPPTIILTANKDDSPFSNEIPNTRGIYIHTKHKTSKKYQVVSYTIEDFPSEDQFDRRLNIYYYLIPIIIGFLTTFIVSIWAYK
ncbi:hypothetical protein M0813_30240 [Anaeramoeba flamelloides]|uniref:Protein BIG1 n=1 Tax=Anaeramoeba flamelloides TaxID=1746091 RepID=A0ABQ8XLX5_9EUKA|nr:hypothetical protein M0813_30240 [Anaeramoeba flamelloides]